MARFGAVCCAKVPVLSRREQFKAGQVICNLSLFFLSFALLSFSLPPSPFPLPPSLLTTLAGPDVSQTHPEAAFIYPAPLPVFAMRQSAVTFVGVLLL